MGYQNTTMNKGAKLNKGRTRRYQLWRIWDPKLNFILFVGLNPSTASELEDDRTITRLIDFAERFGYGGFYIGNLFSIRTPKPKILKQKASPIGESNDKNLLAMANKCTDVCFMWGNNGTYKGRDSEVAKVFPNAFCFGHSKEGNPLHPLYLPKETILKPWRK